MSKRLLSTAAGLVLALSLAGLAAAQDSKTTTTVTTQTTKTIQNPDGTYTVIQYPADKEVAVTLAPGTVIPTAHGLAKVLRHGNMTTINLDLSDITGDVNNYNVYAVDPTGNFTLLGPVTIANGVATQTFTTPIDKFMLVLSPEANLTTIADTTPILFRSTVPEGFAVIPVATSRPRHGAAVGERVAATTAPTASPYTVPMLDIPGFRTRQILLVTTLLDPFVYPAKELAVLYHERWHAELDLRSMKTQMKMEILRCQTPAMVRKEIWAHLLAYNLVRKVMAQAAGEHDVTPRHLSFAGALQTLNEFRTLLLTAATADLPALSADILKAIASHRVGDRPDRCEPRKVKRRPKGYSRLLQPRAQERAACLNG